MASAKPSWLPGVKASAILLLTQLLSWPTLFGVFRFVQKICLHAMNRTSAGFLPVTRTGEPQAVRRVLRGLSSRRDVTILDCGANVGAYTDMVLAECRRAGVGATLHLLEPSSHCYELLAKKYGAQSGAVHVHQLAVFSQSGRAPLFFAWPGAGGTSLSSETSKIQGTGPLGQHSEDVATVSLDDFCAREGIATIDLLKLDIEGAELAALAGAAKMIERGAIGAIQFELGAAALPVGANLYQFWARYSGRFQFYLVMVHGLKRLDAYLPDLECFYAASTFLLVRR